MLVFSSLDIAVRGFIEIVLMIMIYFAIYSVAMGIAYRMTIFYNTLSVALLVAEVTVQVILLNSDYMQMFKYVSFKEPWFLPRMPVVLLIPLIIIFIAGSLIINIKLNHWKKIHVTSFSLKEGADKLPSGICIFYDNGRIIMINTRMSLLYSELTGNVIHNGNEFWGNLRGGFIKDAEIESESADNLIIKMDSGEVWFIEKKRIVNEENFAWQVVAADVTDAYEIYNRIQEKTEKLQKMNVKLQNYNHTVEDMTREEEILRVKIRIHDELGQVLLSTKYFIENGMSEQDAEQLLDMWKRNVNLMRLETDPERSEDYLKILNYAAKTIGVKINWYGDMPHSDRNAVKILIHAGKESLTNTVRHANGNELFINASELSEQWYFEFFNNGKQPEAPVTEGGGLSGLRRRVEAEGGKMKLESYPMFKVMLWVPKEGRLIL